MDEIFKVVFENASVAGIPLLAFVLGLVQWIKGFGLAGGQVKVASMAVGVLLGIGYQFSVQPPVDFASWFAVAVFGIALGLVSSGLYDAAK
jgi:hypothetical protein